MSELQALQNDFLRYLRHADVTIAKEISGQDAETRERRLSIYYNAYRIRLRGSIGTDHDVLGRYIGNDSFEQLAAAYIDACPSSTTSLRHFCSALPDFLRQTAPFSDVAVLADLATFERLLLDVFDAADAESINELPGIEANAWPHLRLVFHPSVRVFVSNWNCVQIWRAIKAEQTPPDASREEHRAWLMWRNPELLTEFRALRADESIALQSAMGGANFASLCEGLLESHAEDAVAERAFALLNTWVDNGLLVEIET